MRRAVDSLDLGVDETALVLLAEGGLGVGGLAAVVDGLAGTNAFGALFPSVLADGQQHERGAVVRRVRLAPGSRPEVCTGLDTRAPEVPTGAAGGRTVMLFVDGLASSVASFIGGVFGRYGPESTYVGGGAGSLTLEQRPCVFTADRGVHQDAGVVALLADSVQTSVRHGWERASDPLVANKTSGNVILELNWRPALEVYREMVEERHGGTLTADSFFDIAKNFPFGIARDGVEDVVRDPIAIDGDTGIACIGEVPENSVVRVMQGTPDSLVDAAADAAREAFGVGGVESCLVVDCVSRTLYLEEAFERELDAFRTQTAAADIPVDGAITLGEISSYGSGEVELFNKSVVVAAFVP